jgi:hypothetical protein
MEALGGGHLMDWSCCFWRCSSVSAAAKAEAAPSLMGVVGADLFFCRECSSSMFCARTGAELSSWHTPLSCFFFPLVSIRANPLEVAISLEVISFCKREKKNSIQHPNHNPKFLPLMLAEHQCAAAIELAKGSKHVPKKNGALWVAVYTTRNGTS